MMRDFSKVLTDFDGEPIEETTPPKEEGGKPIVKTLTLGLACINSLISFGESERSISADEKVKRYKLAHRLHDQGLCEIDGSELALLLQQVGKVYYPLAVGQAFELLQKDPVAVVPKATIETCDDQCAISPAKELVL